MWHLRFNLQHLCLAPKAHLYFTMQNAFSSSPRIPSLKSSLVPKSRFWQSALLVLKQCKNQKFRASKTQPHRPYIPIPNRNRSPEREHLTRILRRRHSVALTLTPCSVNPAPLWFCPDWLCCRAAPSIPIWQAFLRLSLGLTPSFPLHHQGPLWDMTRPQRASGWGWKSLAQSLEPLTLAFLSKTGITRTRARGSSPGVGVRLVDWGPSQPPAVSECLDG